MGINLKINEWNDEILHWMVERIKSLENNLTHLFLIIDTQVFFQPPSFMPKRNVNGADVFPPLVICWWGVKTRSPPRPRAVWKGVNDIALSAFWIRKRNVSIVIQHARFEFLFFIFHFSFYFFFILSWILFGFV